MILWEGRPLDDLPIHERARLGMTLQEPAPVKDDLTHPEAKVTPEAAMEMIVAG